jgi:hypothetical protein
VSMVFALMEIKLPPCAMLARSNSVEGSPMEIGSMVSSSMTLTRAHSLAPPSHDHRCKLLARRRYSCWNLSYSSLLKRAPTHTLLNWIKRNGQTTTQDVSGAGLSASLLRPPRKLGPLDTHRLVFL